MGYTTGQKVTLKSAPYYVSSTASKSPGRKTGTFYIWSAATKNGRIRITSKKSYAGKNPASKYVTCWIKTSSIHSSTSSNSKTSTSSSSTASGNTGNMTTAGTKKTTAANTSSSVSSKVNSKTTVNIVEASNVTPTTRSPGQIGYLGKVIFIVSANTIRTLTNFSWTMQAKYAEHDRHLKRPTLEFTGLNSDKITFDIELSNYLGASVITSYNTLRSYLSGGIAVPLKMGSLSYGNYRWCVESLSFKGGTTDKAGNWITATVSVSLISVEKKR